MASKKKKKTKVQFTKQIVIVNNYAGLFFILLSYVLAFIGRDEIAISLSETVCKEICAVTLFYCCKSFFETKEEKKLDFEKDKFGLEPLELINEEETYDN